MKVNTISKHPVNIQIPVIVPNSVSKSKITQDLYIIFISYVFLKPEYTTCDLSFDGLSEEPRLVA